MFLGRRRETGVSPNTQKVNQIMYIRKTQDTWEVRGNYGYGHGYECVTTEVTYKLGRDSLKCYRNNEPGVSFKLVKVREPIGS